MRDFDWKYVPQTGLVLLTVPEISKDVQVQIADFRDTHALAYAPSGGFIGYSHKGSELGVPGSMRLGKTPLHLVDGIWFMFEDEKGQQAHQHVLLKLELLILKPLP